MMEEQEGLCRVSSALSYAISEWVLMFLLFIDGLFSYTVTRFAEYCNLQIPCLFCSRLDHILGSKGRDFYKNLICISHKKEFSLLAYCHIHQKVSDAGDMCEPCLLSFATKREADAETYRSLVAKIATSLEKDRSIYPQVSKSCAEVPLQNELGLGFIEKKGCSCCKDSFGVNSPVRGLLHIGSKGSEIVEARNEPLVSSGTDCHSEFPNRDNKNPDDPLSHCGDPKLKTTSDSEAPASEDGNKQSVINGCNNATKDFASQSTQTKLDTSSAKNFVNSPSVELPVEREVSIPSVASVITVPVSRNQIPSSEPSDVVSYSLSSSAANEIKDLKKNVFRVGESSSCFDMVPCKASPGILDSKDPKIADIPSAPSLVTDEGLKQCDQVETFSKQVWTNSDSPATATGVLDLNDTYKLVTSDKEYEASPRDPSRPQEDLKLLLSQMSFTRRLDFPWNEITPGPSPRIHAICEETKPLDGSGSSGLQIFTRRFSLERNESGLSSFDGSAFSEIEGENDVDKFKRMVEFEKKQLSILYKELEEERSASAIAANHAMAMITRLQEEKSTMQMEALHYQRMVEEQAEYDHAALQKSSDLLAEKEKELKGLKLELATYRNQSVDMCDGSEAVVPIDDLGEKETIPTRSCRGKEGAGVHRSSQGRMDATCLEKGGGGAKKDIILKFESERLYISKCLKELDNRLLLFSNNGICIEEPDQNDEKTLVNSDIANHQLDVVRDNSPVGEDSGNTLNDTNPSRQRMGLTLPFHAEKCNDYPSSPLASNLKDPDRHFKEVDGENIILDFKAEIFQLSERLKVLEGDCNFIEHTISSLENESEGLQFIQEIACQLQELRKFRMRTKAT